jgi:hypothetical protein
MALPTINDVQAVEPVLTNMLVGYMQADDRFVAGRVFPSVSVEKDSGTYYIVTKKYFFFDDLEERAPGSDFGQLGFGVSTATYTTLQWAGEIPLADEVRANSQVAMDLEQVSLRRLAQASLIRKEVAWAADFMTTSVWGTDDDDSTTDWDDWTNGDPANDVLTAKRTVSNNTGYDPNTMVVGYIVHQALSLHPDILDRVKYTQAATLANVEGAIGAALGIPNYLVAKGTYSNTNENADFSATAIIDDDALICYVDPSAGIFGATAGKTFEWQPGGGGGSIYSRRDEGKHSDMVQHKEQWDQKVTASDVGYFYGGVV